MKQQVVCVKCGNPQVVNKHFKLCLKHNQQRLDDKRTELQVGVKVEKDVGGDGESIAALKQKYSIKKITNKRKEREVEYQRVCKQIDQEREPVCEGCGRGDVALSHSHILSRHHRPDLMCDKRNIRLHCFGFTGNCHQKWENFVPEQVTQMLDFVDNMEYIAQADPKIFQRMYARLEYN